MDLRYGEYGVGLLPTLRPTEASTQERRVRDLGGPVSPLPRPCQAAQPGCEPHL
jgi:hypothetical protein